MNLLLKHISEKEGGGYEQAVMDVKAFGQIEYS